MKHIGNIKGSKVYSCTWDEYTNSFFVIEDDNCKVIQDGCEIGYTDASMCEIYWKKREVNETTMQPQSYFAQFSGVVDEFMKKIK